MPDCLERLAAEKGVLSGLAIMVGGVEEGSKIVVGPQEGDVLPPVPMVTTLRGVHEVTAVGTIFPDAEGRPVLHMHAAFGRGEQTRSGCIRAGIVAWQVLEIILIEISDLDARRIPDPKTEFTLLQCGTK